MTSAERPSRRQGVLAVNIKDQNTLYAAYMPFLKNGGLFIPTNKDYKLGEEVFMLVTLMDESEKVPIPAKVVWVTPPGAQGNRPPGIGVEFNDEGAARVKIEAYLPNAADSERATHTM
jgi:type IV pilus assembly protein PilZ